MLDDLIKKIVALLPLQIREKLPEKFRDEKLGDDDKTGDVKIDVGEVTQIDEEEDSDESSNDDEDIEDDEEEVDVKAKKRSRLIKIIVVGAIVWFGLDMVMEESKQSKKVVKSKIVSKKKQPKLKKKAVAGQKKVADLEGKAVAPESAVAEIIPTMEEKSDASIIIPDFTPDSSPDLSQDLKSSKEVVEKTPIIIPAVEPKVPAVIPITEPEAPVAEPKTIDVELPDSGLILPREYLGEKIGEKSEAVKLDDQINKLFAEDEAQVSQIKVEKLDFERVGAGLVYNCKGKHWACLDRKNYFLCRDLELEVGDGKPDCSIIETYGSIEDCQIMQVYKVNRATAPATCRFDN